MDELTVRSVVDSVVDPCSAGRGVPIGLAAMGLLRTVRIDRAGGDVRVVLGMRVTSPGCSFTIEFDTQIRRRLLDAGADSVEIDWASEFDWTPDDIEPAARQRLASYRDVVRAAASGRALTIRPA